MIDYKALAGRVAQRVIYADNNADPSNKGWAADLRAVVSLLNGMAEAQPVAAVPVDWMERLKEAVKHIGYANVEKWYRLGGEDMIEQAKSDAVTAYATLCEALESLYAAPAAPQAEPIDPHMIAAEDRFPDVPAEQWVTCSQCDGDFDRECPICDGLGKVLATDGEQAEPKPTPASGDDLGVYKGMADSYRNDAEQAEPKREPLTALRILEIEDEATRKWRDNGRLIEYAIVFARMIERAAYERAAQECHAQKGGLSSEWGDGHDTGCDDCFAAIRALGGQHD